MPSSPKTVDVNDSAVDGNSDCDVVAVAAFLFSSLGCCDGHLTLTIHTTSGLLAVPKQHWLLQPGGLFSQAVVSAVKS